MEYLEYFKELKERKNLTAADIAQLADIPVSTVQRIFSGTTPNPTFETISAIAIAVGGSLDEMVGLKSTEKENVPPQIATTLAAYSALLNEKDLRIREKDDNISYLNNELKSERKEKNTLSVLMFAVLAAIIIFFIIDITHGHFGYIRY